MSSLPFFAFMELDNKDPMDNSIKRITNFFHIIMKETGKFLPKGDVLYDITEYKLLFIAKLSGAKTLDIATYPTISFSFFKRALGLFNRGS